jgi:hypothetical protein
VSLNPIHGEVYSIQQYVIKFVSDLWQISVFLQIVKRNNLTSRCSIRDKWNILLIYSQVTMYLYELTPWWWRRNEHYHQWWRLHLVLDMLVCFNKNVKMIEFVPNATSTSQIVPFNNWLNLNNRKIWFLLWKLLNTDHIAEQTKNEKCQNDWLLKYQLQIHVPGVPV